MSKEQRGTPLAQSSAARSDVAEPQRCSVYSLIICTNGSATSTSLWTTRSCITAGAERVKVEEMGGGRVPLNHSTAPFLNLFYGEVRLSGGGYRFRSFVGSA